jgi:hypothetical protein
MTDQFVLDFYASALVTTLATYPTVKMMRAAARDAQLAATLAARKRAEDKLAIAVGGLIWTAMAGSAGASTVPIRSGSWSNNIWTIPVRQ